MKSWRVNTRRFHGKRAGEVSAGQDPPYALWFAVLDLRDSRGYCKESFPPGFAKLAKLTSKNQLTLPKAALQAVGVAEYFDVSVRDGQILLTPVRIQRGDAVRAKLAALGLTAADVTDAVRWARTTKPVPMGSAVAEPVADYPAAAKVAAQKRRRKPARRA